MAVHIGSVIPVDGIVASGEAMVNQASMTGESMPVRKEAGICTFTREPPWRRDRSVVRVRNDFRLHRAMNGSLPMIEESEKLKSKLERKAARLADALVPWSFGGTLSDLASDEECDAGGFNL